MKKQVEYTISKRTNKSGFTWQVQFKDAHGERKSPITIESLRSQMGMCEEFGTHHVKSKVEAVRIVEGAIQKGYTGKKSDAILAKDYIGTFYDWNESDYIRMTNKRRPGSISEATAFNTNQVLHRHVIKSDINTKVNGKTIGYYLSDSLLLRDVTPQMIERLEKSIIIDKGMQPSTWNLIFSKLHCIFAEAERLELIGRNPCDKIRRISAPQSTTTRGCFTKADYTVLMTRIAEEISRKDGITPLGNLDLLNPTTGLALLLLGESAMRPGELRALTVGDISIDRFSDIAIIKISKGIDLLGHTGKTKTKIDRCCYCSKVLAEAIIKNALKSKPLKGSEDTLCFSLNGKNLGSSTLYRAILRLIEALKLPRFDEDGKKISLYSLRHYCNTELNVRGNESIANLILGHETSENAMNRRYNHMNKEQQVLRIGQEIGSILPEEVLAKLG